MRAPLWSWTVACKTTRLVFTLIRYSSPGLSCDAAAACDEPMPCSMSRKNGSTKQRMLEAKQRVGEKICVIELLLLKTWMETPEPAEPWTSCNRGGALVPPLSALREHDFS